MSRAILFFVPANLDALSKKGVLSMVNEREEFGYFTKVITIHPFSNKTQTYIASNCHKIYEIGFDKYKVSDKFKYIFYPIHFFRILFFSISTVRSNKIDLIRGNDPAWMGLFSYLTSIFTKVPYCISIHSDLKKRIALDPKIRLANITNINYLDKLFTKVILRNAVIIMPIRKSLEKIALENGISKDKIKTIPHGIDLELIDSIKCSSFSSFNLIPKNTKIISFVGRLNKENYVYDLLKIIEHLYIIRNKNDFMLFIAGGGKEEIVMHELVKTSPILNKIVRFLGFQPRNHCIALRKISLVNICLMGGYSLLEASASGNPIISYDVEWHRELIQNDTFGYLVNENDIEAASSKINFLLDNPEISSIIGNNAKENVRNKNSLTNTSKIKIQIYEEIISKYAI